MGQSTAGTSLTTTAAAAGRKPCLQFKVDWDNVGFSDALTGWYDETVYVREASGDLRSLNWQRSVAGVGGGVASTCNVTLRNPDVGGGQGFRFSPSNSNGPLYAKLGEGKINMVRAVLRLGFYNVSTPEYLRQITGYIISIRENFKARTVTLEIKDRAADAALGRAATGVQINQSAKDYLQTLVALPGRDPVAGGDQVFDRGAIITEYQWLDDESIWDEIAIVAEAQAGRIWFDKDGDLHFDDSTHWVKGSTNAYDDPTVSQASFTVGSFADLAPSYSLDSVWNHFIVEYSPRYKGWLQPVYTASEILTVAPGESNKEHRAQFHDPVVETVTPVATTDYEAVTAGGIDISSDVTASMTAYGAYAKVYLSNASTDYTAYITRLQIRGCPLLSDAPIKYECEDATSIGKYGRRSWPLRRNPYVQSEPHARMLGDYMLSRFKDPVQVVTLPKVMARPWLEPGDRITVVEALTDLNDAYLIVELGWRYQPTGYTQSITAIRVSDLFPYVPGPASKPYFIIGTTQYGAYGRLFW